MSRHTCLPQIKAVLQPTSLAKVLIAAKTQKLCLSRPAYGTSKQYCDQRVEQSRPTCIKGNRQSSSYAHLLGFVLRDGTRRHTWLPCDTQGSWVCVCAREPPVQSSEDWRPNQISEMQQGRMRRLRKNSWRLVLLRGMYTCLLIW